MLCRRKFIIYSSPLLSSITIGCSTPPIEKKFTYSEKILNLYGLQGKTELIVIGERYHYLFNDSGHLLLAAQASFGNLLTGKFSRFSLSPDDTITGSYKIRTTGTLTETQKREAKQLGFYEIEDGSFESAASLNGMRSTTRPLSPHTLLATAPSSFSIEIDVLGEKIENNTTPHPIHQLVDGLATVTVLPAAIVLAHIFLGGICFNCK